ncbi:MULTISPECIES: glycosyltransferase family 2 protein [Kitasatospora]|uniref:Glycosyltransferase involved in cell wall biosynthesis n=2 Tax=Kitasatospora TaxID=2063 RepID=A0ABT1IU00_9ACTN|nr:glycosyltransferase family 2 protein [Kitasatospora paracochleata]MCP2308615.1 glycosyltransferase involved in cell wall biosynthesis [Kitasatospora paracochleata]
MDAVPTLSVVICTYTLDRWDDLRAAVTSVSGQRRPPAELLVVVDHCPELARRTLSDLPGTRVLANREQRGLSGARNTGVAAARGEVVAFLDDDAEAGPDWTDRLLAAYRDPEVLGVGGHVQARWDDGRPSWFPPEFDWVVGCSYTGLPHDGGQVRNLIGANMSFRRADVVAAGGFRLDLGRVGTRPLGCEETELCIRMSARRPGSVLRYEPAATVRHHVPAQRATWSYFAARCFAEGRSKAAMSRRTGRSPALASERTYLRHVVPTALVRALRHRQLRTAAALVGGVVTTVAGYGVGLLKARVAAAGPGASDG